MFSIFFLPFCFSLLSQFCYHTLSLFLVSLNPSEKAWSPIPKLSSTPQFHRHKRREGTHTTSYTKQKKKTFMSYKTRKTRHPPTPFSKSRSIRGQLQLPLRKLHCFLTLEDSPKQRKQQRESQDMPKVRRVDMKQEIVGSVWVHLRGD